MLLGFLRSFERGTRTCTGARAQKKLESSKVIAPKIRAKFFYLYVEVFYGS
jgi:hypothetical protein